MEVPDAYRVLGLSPGASMAEIEAAYRRAAQKWHPDKNHSSEATARFQRIQRAVDILRQPSSRLWRPSEPATHDREHRAPSSERPPVYAWESAFPWERQRRQEPEWQTAPDGRAYKLEYGLYIWKENGKEYTEREEEEYFRFLFITFRQTSSYALIIVIAVFGLIPFFLSRGWPGFNESLNAVFWIWLGSALLVTTVRGRELVRYPHGTGTDFELDDEVLIRSLSESDVPLFRRVGDIGTGRVMMRVPSWTRARVVRIRWQPQQDREAYQVKVGGRKGWLTR
ncbi:MAG: J domain-containing protein, partial [Deltaproteobacteria bacterium]|nr:J domain-containing protein [Deltaproteobacteria bacterium]